MTRPTVLDDCVVLRQQPAVTRVSAAAVGMTRLVALWKPHALPYLCAPVPTCFVPVCSCEAMVGVLHSSCIVQPSHLPGMCCRSCCAWCQVAGTTCKLSHNQPCRARSIGFAAAAGALLCEAAMSFLRAAEPSGLVLTVYVPACCGLASCLYPVAQATAWQPSLGLSAVRTCFSHVLCIGASSPLTAPPILSQSAQCLGQDLAHMPLAFMRPQGPMHARCACGLYMPVQSVFLLSTS